jgi:hypothetical protein
MRDRDSLLQVLPYIDVKCWCITFMVVSIMIDFGYGFLERFMSLFIRCCLGIRRAKLH